METKGCSKCKEVKPLSEFFNSKNTKNGKRPECKVCTKKDNSTRDYSKLKTEYYENNKTEILKRQRERYKEDSSKKKEYVENNKETIYKKNSDYYKTWYQKNREKKLLSNKLYDEKRLSEDPEYKLRQRLRSRLTSSLKKYGKVPFKERNIHLLIGCSLAELRLHLEGLFKDDMTWENHGKLWHIDHKKPCSLFNLIDIEEQRKCFHFSNLQPLYAIENLKKNAKYSEDND